MNRAARFEDEKRRIIESCFSKLDANGQLAESYITHIRITEDGLYPSAPPPPDSPPDHKKPRLIIIAVRSTGRVRMHKARENNNGSFSIGKTWNMEEMSCIESFASPPQPPQTEREANHRLWAGSTGFVVTISKPYYWQAGTSKEKDFFIASAVKIYRKYTKGQSPELRGFNDQEKAQVLGAFPQAASASAQQPPSQHPVRPPNDSQLPQPPQPPFAQREQSRDGSRYRGSPGPPPSVSDGGRPGSGPSSRRPSESPARFAPGGHPPGPRAFASTEQMRQPSRDGRAELRPGTSPGPGHRQPILGQPGGRRGEQPPPSPGLPPAGLGGDVGASRSRSPAQRSLQHSTDGALEDRQLSETPSMDGTKREGASLFQAARDRYMNYQPHSSPGPDQPRKAPPPQALPQLDTTPTVPFQNGHAKPHADQQVATAASEDSAGIDLDDAAAVGALTSYWGPEHSSATASHPVNDVPTSPATPERSERPPQVGHAAYGSSVDLRPAPLQARSNVESGTDNAAPTTVDAPAPREVAEVRPLQLPTKSEAERSTPGAGMVPPPLQPTPTASQSETPDEEWEEESYRPGLGPMFKKRAIADRFNKAANAAGVFKPRPGGAAEKILKAKADRDGGEPDGITGVVPRPLPRQKTDDTPLTPIEASEPNGHMRDEPPKVEVSSPRSPAQPDRDPVQVDTTAIELRDEGPQLQTAPDEPENEDNDAKVRAEQRQIRQPQVKIKRRSAQQERNIASLGIDRTLLEDKGLDFETMLSEFGWNSDILQPKQLTRLEADIRREQGRAEAGSWLTHTDAAREERVAHVEGLLDKAIAECDELEGLLTLYHVELSSLNDDIAYIEAQSQGLQVQSANQKLLQSELQGLVDTMSLDRRVMEPLRYGNLSDPGGLEEIELSLVKLYQAMLTMDPKLRSHMQTIPRSGGVIEENETSEMVALQEKKVIYDRESSEFCQRLMQFLDSRFMAAMNSAKGRVLRVPGSGGLARLQADAFEEARSGLWMYGPIILFSKELNSPAWSTLLRIYQQRAGALYKDTFKENLQNWKRAARAHTGDEGDVLFTSLEKEDPAAGGLTSTARKLTVKRSQTLAKTFRNASGDKHGTTEHKQPGAMMRAQAFAGAIDEMAPLVNREQNFIVDLFHISSMDSGDFVDAVQSSRPGSRRGTNLLERKPVEPNREVAGVLMNTMLNIFDFFLAEARAMQDWTVAEDPIQGVGVLSTLCRHAYYLQDSNQDYLTQLLDNLAESLKTRFNKFVEEQVRAIEDTKVKIKKRKGVIAFMKIFPHFSATVENTFSAVAGVDYEGPAACVLDVRKLIDEAYEKINRTMFDSLKVIAKESPVAGLPASKQTHTGTDDPEDKEMLNYHILLIENMNHYIEEVDDGGRDGVLAEWKGRALMERMEALEAYISRVIRRPLGKLLDFLESAESILATQSGNPSALAARPSYSRKTMRTLLSTHDGKEVRRGIDTLRKRIDKHFGEADEEQLSRGLVTFVCKECERNYDKVLERLEKLVEEVYSRTEGEKDVVIDFTKADIQAGFRR
ncbi:putative exocyst complex component Sec3 [Septoria linicola]|nr:putative exocyst complex component Sec3 [Septoria linicola]